MHIPKIIHQTAPEDKNRWHPIWEKCHNSWKQHFPVENYDHVFWNDDDLDNLIANNYPEYYELYNSFEFDVMKFDFARLCILHTYGGIYADMDVFCYKNFYNELTRSVNLIQSKDGAHNESVQNSLMASTINNYFFRYCMERIKKKYKPFHLEMTYEVLHYKIQTWNAYVLNMTGPRELTDAYLKYDVNLINVLPREHYNPCPEYYDKTLRTKHMITGRWGKETTKLLKERKEREDRFRLLTQEEFLKLDYKEFRGIDMDNFDFYKNY